MAACLQLGENLAHAHTLHAHAREADDIGRGQALVVDGRDVLIQERDAVLTGRQGRQQR